MSRQALGEFEHLTLLAILHLRRGAYGAAIIDALEDRTGRDVSQAATYIAFKRLEEKGWIDSRKGEPTERRAGRPRRYFRVTDLGREKLREAREGLMNMWTGIVEQLG